MKSQFQKKREAEEAKQAHEEVLNELANLKKQNLEIIKERDRLRSEKEQQNDQEEVSIHHKIIPSLKKNIIKGINKIFSKNIQAIRGEALSFSLKCKFCIRTF